MVDKNRAEGPSSSTAVLAGLQAIQTRIADACASVGRSPADVQLIAVTKTQQPSVLATLARAGVLDFGENRTEHLEQMAAERPDHGRFHYIGRVQSRQFPQVVNHCESLHSLAQLSHVAKLARACEQAHRRIKVFIQVDVSDEKQKAGVPADQLGVILDHLADYTDQLSVAGLMCMAPNVHTTGYTNDDVRRCFAEARELAQKHGLSELSMGMSQDFDIAIQEGATVIRVGSALYNDPV